MTDTVPRIPTGSFSPAYEEPKLSLTERYLVEAFGDLYYSKWAHGQGLMTIQIAWLGYETLKCPLDLWIYQELIVRERPDCIIELGTRFGGSALFMASICDLLGSGEVITIDLDWTVADRRPAHPRIQYITGSTVDSETIAQVTALIGGRPRVMVILDSDHTRSHVLNELRAYAPLIPVGGYMIVEDTNINGHPTYSEFGPGPYEAVEEFLRERDDFVSDRGCERFILTMNPKGYLKRVA